MRQNQYDLKWLVATIAALGVDGALLEFENNRVTFEIIGPDLYTYEETIVTPAANKLERLLAIRSAAEPHIIYEMIDGELVAIHVEPSSQERIFHISWTPTLPSTKVLRARLFPARARNHRVIN